MRLGIAHHLGWAVAVTATVDYTVVDRRRIELIDPDLPAAPIHHRGGTHRLHGRAEPPDDDALAALVAQVRTSVVRATAAELDAIVQDLPEPILSMSIRSWPADFPTDVAPGVTAKDIVLRILAELGTGGGIGYVIEYRGSAIRALSMEGRMTVCNMSIEAGAKAGLIAPDETTFEYVKGRRYAPTGAEWDAAVADWKTLVTDDDAVFDAEVVIDAASISPGVTWGTNPGQVIPLDGSVPDPASFADPAERSAAKRALEYMGLTAGTAFKDVPVDTVFIGSCTNSRIEDLRAAAEVAKGRKVSIDRAMIVPGSFKVKDQAEAEGLHEIFIEAGFDWREPGCSMCLAMNPDKLAPGERCASTSNRNFEGRQGRGGRTHLVSPAVAAATAIAGHFAAPTDLT